MVYNKWNCTFFKINKLNRLIDFVKIILGLLTINTILEYLINLDSFSLIGELILIPTIFLLTIMYQLSAFKNKENPSYQATTKVLNSILIIIGLCILGNTIYKMLHEINEYLNLKTFLISPFLTIIYIPILYLIVIYIKYENAFLILDRYTFLSKTRKVNIKMSFLILANLNLKKLDNMKEIMIWNKRQLREEQNVFNFIKNNIYSVKKNYDE